MILRSPRLSEAQDKSDGKLFQFPSDTFLSKTWFIQGHILLKIQLLVGKMQKMHNEQVWILFARRALFDLCMPNESLRISLLIAIHNK